MGELKKLLMPVVALLIGVGFQLTDKAENEWINPNWWIHGHAIWHIATAVAMLLMYLFLREPSSSEDDLEDEENEVPVIVEDALDHALQHDHSDKDGPQPLAVIAASERYSK